MPPKKTESAATKKVAGGPSYQDMIKDAIINLKDRSGSSRPALKKYVKANNSQIKADDKAFDSLFNRALKAGVEKGVFTQPKGSSGGTKLAPKAAAPKKEKTAAKPAVAKKPKAAATKKAPAAKKAAAPKKAAVKKAPAAKKAAAPKKAAVKKAPAAKKADAVVEAPTTLNKTKTGRVTKTKTTAAPKAKAKAVTKKPAAKKAAAKA